MGYSENSIMRMIRYQDNANLKDFLGANIKDMFYKVVVTAYFEAIGQSEYGLKVWDKKLCAGMGTAFISMFSICNLMDFVVASIKCDNYTKEIPLLAKAKTCIDAYVKLHQSELYDKEQYQDVPSEYIDAIRGTFPFLNATKQEVQDVF